MLRSMGRKGEKASQGKCVASKMAYSCNLLTGDERMATMAAYAMIEIGSYVGGLKLHAKLLASHEHM